MLCPNCGAKVREGSLYCPYCGYKLNPAEGFVGDYFGSDFLRPRVKLSRYIQGMDRRFRPNVSYDTYKLGEVSVEEALDYLRMLPKRDSFPAKLLSDLKRGEDVRPPTIILSDDADYSLNIFTTDGETVGVLALGLRELAGYRFDAGRAPVTSHAVDFPEARRIVEDFFRKVEKVRRLGLGISPLEYSILVAVGRGVSNPKAISSILGVGVNEVRGAMRDVAAKGLVRVRKKGLIKKKYPYELTAEGRKRLDIGRKEIEEHARGDRDVVDALALPFFMMMALDDLSDGIDRDFVVNTIGDRGG